MKRFPHVRPSPAMVVARAALFVSLSGVGYAAIVLPANSVGTQHPEEERRHLRQDQETLAPQK
jgi:hypothetical protein